MPIEKFSFKTATGNVSVLRNGNVATITEERVGHGFSEKSTMTITRMNDTCMHYAFNTPKQIEEIYKNH